MNSNICPVCNEKNVKLVYRGNIHPTYFDEPYKISSSDYGKHLDIFKCQSCITVFEEIRATKKKISRHYQTLNDSAYEIERANRALAFKRIILKLKELKPSGKLLDIGCATGAFLIEAQKLNYHVYGIEPSYWAVDVAKKKYHLKVTRGRIEEINYPENYFDVVTLIDVIEHLDDPVVILKKISKCIKRGGVLSVVTPNIDSFVAKILGEKWWHIRPSHLFYFSPYTLSSLLRSSGFEIIALRKYKWYLSFAYFFERFLKMFSIRLKINSLPLSNITVGINLGDSMEAYAIKK